MSLCFSESQPLLKNFQAMVFSAVSTEKAGVAVVYDTYSQNKITNKNKF